LDIAIMIGCNVSYKVSRATFIYFFSVNFHNNFDLKGMT
jgi:hypothetical protein